MIQVLNYGNGKTIALHEITPAGRERAHTPQAECPQGKQSNYFVAIKEIPGYFLPISRLRR